MPKKAGDKRGKQIAALSAVVHGKETSEEYSDLIDAAEKELPTLSIKEARNLALIKKRFDQNKRIPKELVSKLTEQHSTSHMAWEEARAEDNYPKFAAEFRKVLKLEIECLKLREPTQEPYQTALDMFDPKLNIARVNEIFSTVRERLPPLIQRIANAKSRLQARPSCLEGGPLWDVDKQKALNLEIAQKIGFDFLRGRLDVSTHPFTIAFHPADVRITTRSVSSAPRYRLPHALLVLLS